MYEQTRANLVQAGFHISSIRRREGIDLKKHTDVRRDQAITKYVLELLLPEVRKRFSLNSKLRHVFYVEDDCRIIAGKGFGDVHEAALAAGRKIGWLAYFTRNGEPRWGTHLVSFSRASFVHLEQLLNKHRQGGLPAFDTVLHRLAKDSPESVYIAPAPLAHQAKHALAGRR